MQFELEYISKMSARCWPNVYPNFDDYCFENALKCSVHVLNFSNTYHDMCNILITHIIIHVFSNVSTSYLLKALFSRPKWASSRGPARRLPDLRAPCRRPRQGGEDVLHAGVRLNFREGSNFDV